MALIACFALTSIEGQAAVQALPHAAPRIAIVVGSNVGLADEVELRYAEDDARRIERVLLDLGGYQPGNVHLALGIDAIELKALLQHVSNSGVLKRGESNRHGAAPRDSRKSPLIFFYYSGHADERDLHLRGTRFALEEIRSFLDQSNADVKVALVDACKSGALIREKGAQRGPEFAIDVVRSSHVSGTIVITSSSEDEVSQESDRLQGSFFTHYWVHGLYGAADADDDDQVTLEEAYRFAHFSTVSHTIASAAGVQHPKYEIDLSGEGAIVFSNLAKSSARLEFAGGKGPGSWYILDADRRFLLTEILDANEGKRSLRLPPGRYRIKKREPSRVLVRDVELRAGEVRSVTEEEMTVTRLGSGTGAQKGVSGVRERVSLFSRLTAWSGHGPSLRLGGRTLLFTAFSPGPQAELGWRFGWKYAFIEPRLGLFAGNRADRPATLLFEADFGSAVGLSYPIGPARLSAGLDAGLVLPQTAAISDFFGSRYWSSPGGLLSFAVQGRAFGELAFNLPGNFIVSGRAWGGVSAYRLDEAIITPPALGTSVGVAYRF